ncbi:MAG: cob(I)yrinic acid a,c-diamide adenosyltransferase [Candidatus Magasanikbacteria bacterium]|nr:cob(I)yrinic acid a,c-diamide adenosyltransferase [Candidatus Magasanikbacteria bacterium]
MTKIYTKTGDAGESGLVDGRRAGKDEGIFWVIGSVDELNATLGLAVSEINGYIAENPDVVKIITRLEKIQTNLFKLGAELAALPGLLNNDSSIDEGCVSELENHIDEWWGNLPPLNNFILPGGMRAGAVLHQSRTICRRAERDLVALGRTVVIRPEIYRYVNRLSDWLFAAARFVNSRLGREERIMLD